MSAIRTIIKTRLRMEREAFNLEIIILKNLKDGIDTLLLADRSL